MPLKIILLNKLIARIGEKKLNVRRSLTPYRSNQKREKQVKSR